MPAYNKDSIDHMSVLFMLKAVISVCQYTRCFKKKAAYEPRGPPGQSLSQFL